MSELASILLLLPRGRSLFDPGPAETARRAVELVDEWDDSVIGVVGWSTGGHDAARIAADHPEVERLAIVSTPFPESADHITQIRAKTLLMFGTADPDTGSAHARRWQQAVTDSRIEMVPGAGHDILEQCWKRVLSHLAPGRISRKGTGATGGS